MNIKNEDESYNSIKINQSIKESKKFTISNFNNITN